MDAIDISKVKTCADYIRYLSVESIERAQSGHPGLPLGCAELGVLLYRYILRFNPGDPGWINRDRFILSAGHGSMLLYSLLYVTGYPLSRGDLGEFRQLDSQTPGHPEYHIPHGIETTTGPLGQGFANAVGCALEGKMLAKRFNQGGIDLFDYTVYTLVGDGCMMEGISSEAGSLAGHLGLDNLAAIYDSNGISIDGRTDITFTEDTAARFKAMGWQVEKADITEIQDLYTQLKNLKKREGKPKLLVLKTTIGEGLDKKRDIAAIHGSPAGIDEIAYFIQHSKIKSIFENKYGKSDIQDKQKLIEILTNRLKNREPLLEELGCLTFMKEGATQQKEVYNEWLEKFETYKHKFPQQYELLSSYLHFKLPGALREELLNYNFFKGEEAKKTEATRNISGKVLNLCAVKIPQIVGGSADLAGSTKAKLDCIVGTDGSTLAGQNIFYGVREHAMGAIGNGLALNRILIPFSGTFFTFFDYMKPAVRMAALMKINHLFIFSHDSIYVGEDGPTHQPIEHLNALRLIPNIYTFRPANDVETAFTYLYFFQEMKGPVAVVTSRQKLPQEVFALPKTRGADREALYEQFKKGAYIFYESPETQEPDLILIASGSEVALTLQTAKLVEEKNQKSVRVISMPCLELFTQAEISYRKQLLLEAPIPLVVIEAASHRGVGLFYDPRTILVDIESFGKSGPDNLVGKHFGFTPEAIYKRILEK